ncbi:MAG TPA: BBE domain-containing protein, partial [Gammaproteobacteria bacterium]|nr:BBE domain-containing protein [Gammaproteobacteria bacterium]
LSAWIVLRKAPPLPFLDPSVHGRNVVIVALCHAGAPEQGQSLIEPLLHLAEPCGAHVGAVPYTAWQQAFDGLLTPGARNYWKSHNLGELSDGLLATLMDYAGRLPGEQCELFLAHLGGAVNRVAADATAYPHRGVEFVVNVHARWEAAEDDGACRDWARGFFRDAAPYALGTTYVNFMTADEAGRVPAVYGATYGRLAEVKRRYDPINLFRNNQNIRPAA